MSAKLTSIIASDYTDGTERYTAFQLCEMERGRLAAVSTVIFNNESVTACASIARLAPRAQAVIRLARIYRSRSIPQVFAKLPSRLIA